MIVPDCVRLPLAFDVAEILGEIDALPDVAWEPHFNSGYYSGDWSGLALRSRGGVASLYPGPPASDAELAPFVATPALAACPRTRRALARFECPLTSVRVLRLGPQAAIREHRDYHIGFEAGEIRVHVPLATSDDVEFVLGANLVRMRAGEAWYLDVTQPHRVRNSGAAYRLHLVIDCVVDDWLRAMLDEALATPFDRFAEIVARDRALESELWNATTLEAFARLAVLRASERGIALDERDAHAAIARGANRWYAALDG